jgi:hypothetical protein
MELIKDENYVSFTETLAFRMLKFFQGESHKEWVVHGKDINKSLLISIEALLPTVNLSYQEVALELHILPSPVITKPSDLVEVPNYYFITYCKLRCYSIHTHLIVLITHHFLKFSFLIIQM